MRLNKLPWNEPEIFRILYQIGTKETKIKETIQ